MNPTFSRAGSYPSIQAIALQVDKMRIEVATGLVDAGTFAF
jgi:hypothetical protein